MEKFKDSKETGFSSSADKTTRLLNQNGSFNVKHIGIPYHHTVNAYHFMISISWVNFFLVVFFSYLIVNTLFAFLYLFIGLEHLAGITGNTTWDKFLDSFFFSAQTLTTVGYGRISPVGSAASTVAAFESLIGLLSFALATGVLYGRFSRPVGKIAYSEYALISPYKDINAFEFRIANKKKNSLIEAEVQIVFSWIESENDKQVRKFYPLKLEIPKINIFALSWTVVHPITEESPLYKVNSKDLIERNAEFLIIFKAFDDTFAQTVHSRSSYKAEEIAWGAKFVPMFHSKDDGNYYLEFNKLSQFAPADLA